MNVTFLSSTGTFGGLLYNMSKVDKNAADILEVQNMPGLSHRGLVGTRDYIDYMKGWSEKNSRVKSTQLHVAISCKGNEKGKEELLVASKEWLKKMGYSDVPAMFFFHHDTENNHIHIVSSRIDKSGKKINDSHERRRGRTAILEISKIDLVADGKEAIKQAFEYRFTTKMQFVALLEAKGYSCKEEDAKIHVFREGKFISSVENAKIDESIKNIPDVNDKRKAQLRAFLEKYKERVPVRELPALMKRYFGVELKFFGREENPYGYMLIDHTGKTVYKGSEILPIKSLMSSKEAEKTLQVVELVRAALAVRHIGLVALNEQIRAHGYYISGSGYVYHYGQKVDKIGEDILNEIKYNNRLDEASKFSLRSVEAIEALAKSFQVDKEDLGELRIEQNSGYNAGEKYQEGVSSGDLAEFLRENNMAVVMIDDKKYLIDHEEMYVDEISGGYEESVSKSPQATLFNMNDKGSVSSEDNHPRKRKRK